MPSYAIFRVSDKKYKSFQQLAGYQNHMERLIPVPNSDRATQNRRLIGTGDIVGTVREYIKDCKLRKDSVLARDIILTASPEFFNNATREQKNLWVQKNLQWLKDTFGDNCVYATLHQDEKTPHISALICAKHYNDNKQTYTLANHIYFGGPAKLSAMQDNYSAAMKDFDLNRGLRFSKAKHIQIRHFYSLINKEIDLKDINSLTAQAKNSELLAVKVKALQNTLSSYRLITQKSAEKQSEQVKVNADIHHKLKQIQQDNETYKEVIGVLSKHYKIPATEIKSAINFVRDKTQGAVLELKK